MLDISEHEGIAVLRMRQLGVNRLNVELLRRITAALEFVRTSIGVVLTGYRSTFALDADQRCTDDLVIAQHATLLAMRRHPRPVVAAVNGDALGSGFDLAAAAQVRVMSDGVIGTSRGAAFTVAQAAAIALVERSTGAASLLDEAVARALSLSRQAQRSGVGSGQR